MKFSLIFNELKVPQYERVVEVKEDRVGLHAIIAIHNTSLGPALGGIRAYPYPSFEAALTDVLRLSKGMTYKSAVAQTGTGGGKSVIITKPGIAKTEAQLLAFGEAVNYFQGNYICAEDVGVSVDDLSIIRQATRFAVGLAHPSSSGDPSPFTAWGGFLGIQAVCQFLYGNRSPKGRKIAIQGLGSVGMKLASYLFWEGAELIVSDIDEEKSLKAAKEFDAQVVPVEDILRTPCDILSPCALGGILNAHTIPHLKCRAVAGVANNQLFSDEDGEALCARGILCAPDYTINAGGLINVCTEIDERAYSPFVSRSRLDTIFEALLKIFEISQQEQRSPYHVANEIAEKNLALKKARREKAVTFHH